MKTVYQAFDPKRNNFNLIRLFAAILVLVSHCYPLTGRTTEPFASYLGDFDTGGGWGVSIFFVISGFLVTRSVLERSVGVYLRSRILRIVPALTFVSLFEILVLGPLFTKLPIGNYFSNPGTYSYLRNATVYWLDFSLPGVFASNPVSGVANGSLWTLPIESAFYVLLPVLSVFGLLKPERILLLLAVVAFWLAFGIIQLDWNWTNQGGMLFAGGPTYSTVKEGVFFLLGACLWILRDRIPFTGGLAACCVLLLLIFAYQKTGLVAMYLALPYLVIYVAMTDKLRFPFYEKIGDLSYGTYLFAYPVQQAIVAICGNAIGPKRLAALALPLTLMLAALSWYSIERPILAIRHGDRYRRPVADHDAEPMMGNTASSRQFGE